MFADIAATVGLIALALGNFIVSVEAIEAKAATMYSGTTCSAGTALMMEIDPASCTPVSCSNSPTPGTSLKRQCTTMENYATIRDAEFGNRELYIMHIYSDSDTNCAGAVERIRVQAADGACFAYGGSVWGNYVLNADGSVTVTQYGTADCSGSPSSTNVTPASDLTGTCVNHMKITTKFKITTNGAQEAARVSVAGLLAAFYLTMVR